MNLKERSNRSHWLDKRRSCLHRRLVRTSFLKIDTTGMMMLSRQARKSQSKHLFGHYWGRFQTRSDFLAVAVSALAEEVSERWRLGLSAVLRDSEPC